MAPKTRKTPLWFAAIRTAYVTASAGFFLLLLVAFAYPYSWNRFGLELWLPAYSCVTLLAPIGLLLVTLIMRARKSPAIWIGLLLTSSGWALTFSNEGKSVLFHLAGIVRVFWPTGMV